MLPYFIAAHPGSRIEDMIEVARFLKRHSLRVEQCQIFTPIPGTASAVMYATALDPYTGGAVYVERDPRRREMQKALILRHLASSRPLIMEALRLSGRTDPADDILGGQHGPSPATRPQVQGRKPGRTGPPR